MLSPSSIHNCPRLQTSHLEHQSIKLRMREIRIQKVDCKLYFLSYQSHTMSCFLRLVISSDLSFNWYAHFIYSRCRVRVASAEGFPLDYIVVDGSFEPNPGARVQKRQFRRFLKCSFYCGCDSVFWLSAG